MANFTKSLQDRQKFTRLTKVTVPNTTKVPYCKLVKFKQCMYSELIYSYIYIGILVSKLYVCAVLTTVDKTKGKATDRETTMEGKGNRINQEDKLLHLPFKRLENPQVWKGSV